MIVGLLLAAGGATRFGSQKLVAPLDGQPLVCHAATTLAGTTDSVTVVVGHDAGAVRDALRTTVAVILENPDWASGLSSSLRRGVASLDSDVSAVIVALGDEPRLDARVIRSVMAVWRSTGAPIVAARYRGTQGRPVLFDRSVFPELLALEGDVGAKPLFARAPERMAYVDVDSAPPRDVDTTLDLERLSE